MVTETVHPADSGADEDSRIWAELQAAEDREAAAAGEDPPEPRSTETTTTTEDPPAPAVTDIWANAPEPLRAAFEATRQHAETEAQNHRRVAGVVSALQRQLNEIKTTKTTTPAQAEAVVDALDSPELKQALEEYPEVLTPLVKTLKALQGQIVSQNKLVTERFTTADQRDAENYYTAQENALTERVPDWRQALKTPNGQVRPEFINWLNQQPQYVREGIERNGDKIVDAHEAADIIGRFKAATGAQTTPHNQANKRQAQLESAAAPKGRGPARVTTAEPDPDTDPQGYWNYLAEQDRRRAKSR